MSRSYDTRNGQTFPRAFEIVVSNPSSQAVGVIYKECMAIVDGGGTVRHLDTPSTTNAVVMEQLPDQIQLIDPVTGFETGGYVTLDQIKGALLALVRADQLRRDSLPP